MYYNSKKSCTFVEPKDSRQRRGATCERNGSAYGRGRGQSSKDSSDTFFSPQQPNDKNQHTKLSALTKHTVH